MGSGNYGPGGPTDPGETRPRRERGKRPLHEPVLEERELLTPPQSDKQGIRLVPNASAVIVTAAVASGLAVSALLGIAPLMLTQLSLVAGGSGLLMLGVAIAARAAPQLRQSAAGSKASRLLSVGLVALLIGGSAVVALAVGSQMGFAPMRLISAAVAVFGGTLALGSTSIQGLTETDPRLRPRNAARRSYPTLKAAAAASFDLGVAGLALGILALVYNAGRPVVDSFAILGLGCALLLAGVAVRLKLRSLLR